MLSKRTNELQSTDNLSVIKYNLGKPFEWGKTIWCAEPDGGYGKGIVGLGWFVTLPITAIFYPIVKTTIDFCTRKPMPKTEYENMMSKLNNLNGEQIDKVVEIVLQSENRAQSTSSKKVFETLKDAELVYQNNLKQITNEKEAKIKEQKNKQKYELLNEMLSKQQSNNQDYKINLTVSYKISEEDKKLIASEVEQQEPFFKQQKRERQQLSMFSFLNERKNAGKRTQYLIKDAIDNVVKNESSAKMINF